MWQTTLLYSHKFCVNSGTFRHFHMHKGAMSTYCGCSSISHCIIYRSHLNHMERCVFVCESQGRYHIHTLHSLFEGVSSAILPNCFTKCSESCSVFGPGGRTQVSRVYFIIRVLQKFREKQSNCSGLFNCTWRGSAFSLNSQAYFSQKMQKICISPRPRWAKWQPGGLTNRYAFIHMNVTHVHQRCRNSTYLPFHYFFRMREDEKL